VVAEENQQKVSALEVFLVFLRLGLTSFGGPIAHIGYFRDEFVSRRRWLSEHSYADLVALCQFLPGPASSQVGLALGLSRAGYRGALAAWLGFTLPSALALILLAVGIYGFAEGTVASGLLSGLKVVAVAVVAQAVWGMAKNLCPDTPRLTLMAVATCLVLLLPSVYAKVGVIVATGIVGLIVFKPAAGNFADDWQVPVTRGAGAFWLGLFFFLLLALPILLNLFPSHTLALIDSFYRAGALVFGGGHVVLPLLQAEVVPPGWVSEDMFLAGYGAAQAVPGPLFTFAAFLGASMTQPPTALLGGLICLLAIFTPSFLLIAGALPFWQQLRASTRMQSALMGINAGVVGLLLAALYDPVWTSAIVGAKEFAMALVALIALMAWKIPPWLVVIATALTGLILT
jgi:chromate transporter